MSPGDLFLLPELIPALLVAAPLFALGLAALDRRRARRLAIAVGPRTEALAPDPSPRRRRARRALAVAALALALLAAMQPTFGRAAGLAPLRGVDVVVTLDVSRSMLARDAGGSRLESAKREIRALAERVRGDRLALVAFAGEARLVVPLTRDMDSFLELLDLAEPETVRTGGTDLGAAIEKALRALSRAKGDHAAVILVTDGEDHEGRGLEAAKRASERGFAVHAVGIGSAAGSKIAIDAEAGAAETFLRDAAGEDVVSAMDPASLRRVAEAGGGAFADAGSLPLPLVEIHEKRILPAARRAFEAEEGTSARVNRFQWPLLAAIACGLLGLGLAERRRR